MKSRQKISIIVVLIGLMVVGITPALAGAIKTPVTGTFSLKGTGPSPDYLEWWSSDSNDHVRNLLTYWENLTNDPRINGWAQLFVNADYNYDANGDLKKAHLWGEFIIFPDQTYTVELWKCHYTGWFEPEGKSAMIVCKGRGENEGLVAKMTITTDSLLTSNYDLLGEIIEPGGK
jgi:hypothetical protein